MTEGKTAEDNATGGTMAEGNGGGSVDTGERTDYAGPFDPAFDYEDLSKEALVRLVREYALIVHLLDRSMCASIGMRYGAEAVKELAIEEWAGASPSMASGCAAS